MIRCLNALLLGLLVGCVRSTDTQPRASTCNGSRFVIVSNNWTRGVDVWVQSRAGSVTTVGSVTPGSRGEFPVPDDGYAGLRLEGDTRNGGLPYGIEGREIRMSYICR
jgi:hypothetical protein